MYVYIYIYNLYIAVACFLLLASRCLLLDFRSRPLVLFRHLLLRMLCLLLHICSLAYPKFPMRSMIAHLRYTIVHRRVPSQQCNMPSHTNASAFETIQLYAFSLRWAISSDVSRIFLDKALY